MSPLDSFTITHFEAFLFDFDGTLVDSMPAHNLAWKKTLLKYGVELSDKQLQELAGIPNEQTAQIFINQYELDILPKTIVQQKELQYQGSLASLKTIPMIYDIVLHFFQKIPLGVISGSSRSLLEESLTALQLKPYFQTIVSCDDTVLGKPYPDPFLLGAKQLDVTPVRCLVFEDGMAGIQSALAAGMTVLQYKQGALIPVNKD